MLYILNGGLAKGNELFYGIDHNAVTVCNNQELSILFHFEDIRI